MSENLKWADLAIRLSSALAMVVVGIWGVWMGSHIFHILVAVICGLMIWELVRMIAPRNPPRALQLGTLSGVALIVAI
jgi:phosphatidate cytidylyltransferase